MRFGDSGTVHNPLKQQIAFIRVYLDTIWKTLLVTLLKHDVSCFYKAMS